MTLNEARDIIVAMDPKRSICIDASCWHHTHEFSGGPPTNETSFGVSIFGTDGTTLEKQYKAASLDALIDLARRWINRDKEATGQPAEATTD